MRFDPEAWSLDRPSLGSLDSILVKPAKSLPSCLVVLSHGFGASASNLLGLFEEVLYFLPEDAAKPAFLFPEAPIDLEDEGMFGARAWWRINMAKLMEMSATDSFGDVRDAVPNGIDEARLQLCMCIEACREQQKWDNLPIVLGGFSQGAMLTVDTALRGTVSPIIGLLVFSGALICESLWRRAAAERPLHVPVVQSHGREDQVLSIATGRWLNSLLNEIGCEGELAEFHGPHTIPTDALEATAKLLNKLSSNQQ